MKQLQQPVVAIELLERRHRRVVEAGIGVGDDGGEIVVGDAAAQERRHHPRGQFGIGQAGHGAHVGSR